MDESAIQRNVFKWSRQPGVRSHYPELKLLHHIPNGGERTSKQGAILKLEGVKRGVPDLCLPVKKGNYGSLYIELKAESGTASADQEWWIEELNKCGCFAKICFGYKPTIETILWYLSLEEYL